LLVLLFYFFWKKKNSPNFWYYKIKKIKNLAYISATWEEIFTWWVCEFLDFSILKNDLIIISSFEFGDKNVVHSVTNDENTYLLHVEGGRYFRVLGVLGFIRF